MGGDIEGVQNLAVREILVRLDVEQLVLCAVLEDRLETLC